LEELDLPVRDDYAERRGRLEGLLADHQAAPGELASAFGELGMWHQAYQYSETADIAFRNALSLAPEQAVWRHYLALVAMQRGQDEKASRYLEEVLQLERNNVPALVLAGELELRADRRGTAQSHFERALSLRPDCARALLGLGQLALDDGEHQLAIGRFQAALRRQPEGTAIHQALGIAFRELGELDRAEVHLSRVANGEPVSVYLVDRRQQRIGALRRDAKSLGKRAQRLLAAGETDEGIALLRKAISAGPNRTEFRLQLARALLESGQVGEAARELVPVLRSDPNRPTARFLMAVALSRQEAHDDAMYHFRAVLRVEPTHFRARYGLAHELIRTGRPDAALHHLTIVIEQAPDHPDARRTRAATLSRLGRFAILRRALEEDHEALPSDSRLSTMLARLLATAPDPALRDGPRSELLAWDLFHGSPTLAHAETMAMAEAELGRFDRALAWQRAALEAAVAAGRADLRSRIEGRMQLYVSGHPCRERCFVTERETGIEAVPPPHSDG